MSPASSVPPPPNLAAIAEEARRARLHTSWSTPRWMWILAVVVGGVCAVAFAIALVGEPAAPAQPVPRGGEVAGTGGRGFGVGLVLGVVAGIAIGLAIARQRGAHSSRSKP